MLCTLHLDWYCDNHKHMCTVWNTLLGYHNTLHWKIWLFLVIPVCRILFKWLITLVLNVFKINACFILVFNISACFIKITKLCNTGVTLRPDERAKISFWVLCIMREKFSKVFGLFLIEKGTTYTRVFDH